MSTRICTKLLYNACLISQLKSMFTRICTKLLYNVFLHQLNGWHSPANQFRCSLFRFCPFSLISFSFSLPSAPFPCGNSEQGTLGANSSVPCREVVPISEVKLYTKVLPQQVSFVERSSLSQRIPYRRFHCISSFSPPTTPGT